MKQLIRLTPISKTALICKLCPRHCIGVDRVKENNGYCEAGSVMEAASLSIHRGEEPFLTGKYGVGNVFFSHCNMSCIYCQNFQISGSENGTKYTPDELSEELLNFQKQGCPTVGFVSPGHYLPLIAETIKIAKKNGLTVPIVWNSNGYEEVESLQKLEGLVDIYLPDFKYWNAENALLYSDTPNYPSVARDAVKEMFRQVGPLQIREGIATKGLSVRHLVLPNDIADTEKILQFISSISKDIYVSLMSQYNPVHKADDFILLSRKLRPAEYWRTVEIAEELGLKNLLIQEPDSSPDSYLPDFQKENVFNEKNMEESL